MTHKLIIPGRLPTLNEYSAAERTNAKYAAKLKKDTENMIAWLAITRLPGLEIKNPVHIDYLWIEKDKRRDLDNISFAQKFVQDALVKAGVLKNDGWKHVEGFSHSFAVDAKNPRVEVSIREVVT